MRDIETRHDIESLMDSFYKKAFADDIIGYLFTDVAQLDLESHLPIISDFWEMILFQTVNFQERYRRSPMLKHVELNEKEPLVRPHFTRWLNLFYQTIDENFAGEKADLAKNRAKSIAETMFLMVNRDNPAGVGVVRQ